MSDKKAVPLGVMLGAPELFTASNGKVYEIAPLLLKEVPEFQNDRISIGAQIFNITDEEAKQSLEKWVARKFQTAKGQAVTVQDLMNDDWTVVDLKNAIRKLADISG
ncbi:MAG: hypothetical protein HPY66_1647 [Firmicutes bacterium]|nr:hypothetical protein [Bacillota bacterium]